MRVKGKADVDVEITTSELVVALKKEVYATLHLPAPIEGRVFVKDLHLDLEMAVYYKVIDGRFRRPCIHRILLLLKRI